MKINFSIVLILLIFLGCRSSILVDPSTEISYSIPQKSHVKLTVENSYDTLIQTLIDDVQEAGHYSVMFNASNLPEGVYFYIIELRGINNDFYYKSGQTMLLAK